MSAATTFDVAAPGAVRGRPVRGRVVVPAGAGPFPFVVCVHGYTVSSEWGFWPELGRRLAECGIASVRVTFSGDGLAADLRTVEDLDAIATNTYVAELDDLAALRTRLRDVAVLDGARIALVGHSRGGGIGAIHAAEVGDYRAVALWAAFDHVLRFTPERLAAWRRDGTIDVLHHGLGRRVPLALGVLESAERAATRLDVLAAMRRLRCPVLVAHGGRDRSLAPVVADRLAAAATQVERLTIDDAGHGFGARDPLDGIPDRLERLLATTVAFVARAIA